MPASRWTRERTVGVVRRLAAAEMGRVYFILAMLGVLPLIVLTPPFQVPDEQQHFFRAYQLSELSLHGVGLNGAAGAMLPSSLPELAEHFLGSRALHADRAIRTTSLTEIVQALATPLDPERREFVDFTGAAFYAPLPYLPQIVAIGVLRQAGVGPLGLLYAARLANAVAAALLVTLALRVFPSGKLKLLALVAALLPMVVFEFASVSPDAGVIASALLFTAIATQARLSGRWRWTEVAVAVLAGVAVCSLKPVYAPLLLIGLPAAGRPGRAGHVLRVHAVLTVAVLGAAAFWLGDSAASLVLPRAGTDLRAQAAEIAADPLGFAVTVTLTVLYYAADWARGAIGVLGWLTIRLPTLMYWQPVAALAAAALLPRPPALRVGVVEALWQLLLLLASVGLILLALYLYWTPLGSPVIQGVQGRYVLPLAGLACVTLCATLPVPPHRGTAALTLAVFALVATEVVETALVALRAFWIA